MLAKTLKDTAYRWLSEPRWYLWEGGFLLIARADGVVPAHAHHAIQIVVALDGTVAICGEDNRWRRGPGIIVQPDVVHSFDCNGAMGAMLFVDPESNEGAWLHRALEQEIAVVPDARLASSVSELRTFIEQPIDPIADRQLALLAMPFDVFRAAALAGGEQTLLQLGDELLHAVTIALKDRVGGIDVRREDFHDRCNLN